MPDPVVQHAEEWLRSRRSTLFGQAFDVSKDTEQAARWFITQVDEFLTYVERAERLRERYPKFPPLPRQSFDVV